MIINPYRYGGVITLIYDTFTDTDTTTLETHTPDTDDVGSGWARGSGGSITISGNKALAPGTATQYSIDAGAYDAIVTADITFASSATAQGLVAREQVSYFNCWRVEVTSAGTSNPVLNLSSRESTLTVRNSVTMTGEGPLTGETWPMSVTCSGDDITGVITVNGTDYTVTYNSSLFNTSTKFGLRCISNSYDEFLVTTL